MIKSLCRSDNQKKLAASQALIAAGSPVAMGSEYELMLGRVAQYRIRLKTIKSHLKKSEVKAEILPEMSDYIEGVLEAGTGQQDDNLIYYMIWSFDADNMPEFLRVAEYAIASGLVMPEQFSSDLVCWVADSAADRVIRLIDQGEPAVQSFIFSAWALVKDADLLDLVSAKMRKAMGLTLLEGDKPELEKALLEFKAAVKLNDRIGVKNLIKDIEKKLPAVDGSGKTAGEGGGSLENKK